MARLVVLRGQTPFREIELIQFPVRIGRSQQNELVLEDPLNSVSRSHAEVRFENGRYLLVDTNSENGIWVSGMRESMVALDPNVVASIGPFRLKVEGGAAVAADAPPLAPPKSAAAPPPSPPPARAAASSDTTRTVKKSGASSSRNMLYGGIALVVVLVIAGVLLLRPGTPERSAELVRFLDTAKSALSQGNCAAALTDGIEPALAIDPADAEALGLKQQADACVAAAAPPQPEDPATLVAQHLALATQLLDGNDCAGALTDHINRVLETDPANAEALALKTRAEACAATVPAATTTVRPAAAAGSALAKAIPPANGGLDPLAGETQTQYTERVQQRRAAYDQAVAQLQARNYAAAVTGLETVRQSVPAGYLDLDANLAAARKGLRTSAQSIRTRAGELEKAGNWDAALREYRRAHDADPDLSVDADIKRVTDQKVRAGEEACEAGRRAYAVGNVEGYRTAYQRAFALLPQGHECYETARVRGGAANR